MKYTIVPISEKYIEGFNAAVDKVSRERKYLSFLEGPSIEMSRAFVSKNLTENRPHFVALVDDKVVGWCDIASLDRPIFSHAGTLGIGVIAEYRGHGIGSVLISAALEKAQLIGLTRIELTVMESNKRAMELYKSKGFVIEGLHRNAVLIDNKYENLIPMALLFNS
jgi:ribosomal protein S18 acetylase RimI-like enzyme